MALGSAILAAGAGAFCVAWFVTLPEQAAEMYLVWLIITRLATLPIVLVFLAGVLLFGCGLIFFLGRLLLFWQPIFEIGPEGILYRASGASVGFVPWEEVKKVRPAEFQGQRSVAIWVKNERGLLERQNPLKRLLIRINRRYFGSGPIHVPLNVLAIPEEELAAEITRYLNERGGVDGTFLPGARAGRPGGKTANRRRSSALRIAGSVVRGIAVVVLSLFYYVTSSMLMLFGGLLAWNGLSPGIERNASQAHPVGGAILIVLGILIFIFFPRLVRKLTGHEVLSTPYGGF